jgi:GNAT superfamily N-acetyltransferase
MQYKQEFLLDVKDEVVLLIQDHFDEVYPARKVFKFDMDWDLYSQLENLGLLKIFTARDDGSLVGYLFVVLSPNLHSKGSMLACDDGLYVAKSHRGKSVAKDLVCFTEHCLKKDGVKVFHIVGTTEKPIDSLVKRMGYVKVETKFQKVL